MPGLDRRSRASGTGASHTRTDTSSHTRGLLRWATPPDLRAHLESSTLLSLQGLVGNRAVCSLIQGRKIADPIPVQRQVAIGSYRMNAEGHLRRDDKDHTEVANVPVGSKVKVRDRGGRVSLFKAGWFSTNEHSWSEMPNHSVGWVDDAKLERSLADELEQTFSGGGTPSIVDLQGIIGTATPEQKKKAADDDAFLGRAKVALNEDTYLGLLPALGVHRMPSTSTGKLGTGERGHVTAEYADTQIRAHLQLYLAEAVKAGRQVQGEVSVVGDADFQAAFDRQWVRAAGQAAKYRGRNAWDVCNAFVDVNLPQRHIWVHRNMGGQGTVIHEGMHKYASDQIRNEQVAMCNKKGIDHGGISRLDEGITEYFTRIVVNRLPMEPRTSYGNEWKVASRLASKVGEPLLAQAYYDGQFDALKSAIGVDWPNFAEHLEMMDWGWLKTNGYMP